MKLDDILAEATIFDERELLNTPWKSPRELISWLRSKGFRRLGGGVFSAAYGKPGHKRIVKISKREDKCWIQFANWAMRLTANPYIPNIYWFKPYKGTRKGKQETFFVTLIERLRPFTIGNIKRIDDPVIVAALLRYGYWVEGEQDELEDHLDALGYGTSTRTVQRILKQYSNHKFVQTIKRFERFGGPECSSDIHSGNLMLRDDGTLVITDPLAGEWT